MNFERLKLSHLLILNDCYKHRKPVPIVIGGKKSAESEVSGGASPVSQKLDPGETNAKPVSYTWLDVPHEVATRPREVEFRHQHPPQPKLHFRQQ